jgi:hypothetical protein
MLLMVTTEVTLHKPDVLLDLGAAPAGVVLPLFAPAACTAALVTLLLLCS